MASPFGLDEATEDQSCDSGGRCDGAQSPGQGCRGLRAGRRSYGCIEEMGSGNDTLMAHPRLCSSLPTGLPAPSGSPVCLLCHSQSHPIKPQGRACLTPLKLSMAPTSLAEVRVSQSLRTSKCLNPTASRTPSPFWHLILSRPNSPLAVSPPPSHTPA